MLAPALRDKLTYQPGAPTSSNGGAPCYINRESLLPRTSALGSLREASLWFSSSLLWLHLTLETLSLAATPYHFLLKCQSNYSKSFPNGSDDKDSACNAVDPGLIRGQEDPLEKGMATHSGILAWRIPRTEEVTVLGVKTSWTINFSGYNSKLSLHSAWSVLDLCCSWWLPAHTWKHVQSPCLPGCPSHTATLPSLRLSPPLFSKPRENIEHIFLSFP